MAKKYDCTILVNSCDKYQDILDTFFELLHRFWSDLPFEIALTTETLEYQSDYFKIKNIHPKDKNCTWTERIAEALHEINTNYVLLMLDDFFLYDYVKTSSILSNLKILKKNDNIVNFTYWPILDRSEECGIPGFRKRQAGASNKIAAVAALWNKKQFLKYVEGYKENIWEFESKGTIRSNEKYPEDEFYISKDFSTQIIPYDFNKYGLFSGKWLKENIELTEKLGIKIDFSKRGFYNPKERGLTKSFISAFKLQSYIVAKYNYTKDNPIHYHEFQKPGYFEQEYKLDGATDILYWKITDQWCFLIKNLVIEVTYFDESVSVVDNKTLFGNFLRIHKSFVFNKPNPIMYIPTKRNTKIDKIKIKGYLQVPIPKILAHISFNRMRWNDPELDQIKQDINTELFLVKDIVSSIMLNPEVRVINKGVKKEKILDFEERTTKEIFKYKLLLDTKAEELEWKLSNYAGYSIANLKITYKTQNNKIEEIKHSSIKGLPKKIEEQYVFIDNNILYIKLPRKNIKEIYISGKINCPMDKKVLNCFVNKK